MIIIIALEISTLLPVVSNAIIYSVVKADIRLHDCMTLNLPPALLGEKKTLHTE